MEDQPKLKLIVSPEIEAEDEGPYELEFDLHLEGTFSLENKASKEEITVIAQSLLELPDFQKDLLSATREVYQKWISDILE